ncbi:acyltransferase family protein [Leifsonia sp. 2MCAF36]|uniref:acyltransferase family protein n=1 Tax=Leifsonia sp. 2MCAF36 TaxID=3232988 RepID=UPI003F956A95
MVTSFYPRRRDRYSSLDGLRGVAAIVVLLHHTAMIVPGMVAAYTGAAVPANGSLTWWFSYTPLRLLTAGSEAVTLFFVLSGFVLALPVLRSENYDWIAYYPRRVVRIGLPSAASVVLAFGLLVLVPQIPHDGISAWLAGFSIDPLDWKVLVQALDPFAGDHRINGPLWSIYWEMVFSMTLPLFVGIALVARRFWPVLLAAATVIGFFGAHIGADGFRYLPAFLVGTVAAVGLPRIRAAGAMLSGRWFGHLAWVGILSASCALLILRWLVPVPGGERVLTSGMSALWPIAALGILICCLEWRPAARLLSGEPFRWAGKISFSLYLVHVPILFAFRYAFDGSPLTVVLPCAAATAIVAAMLFHWLVEKRTNGLSRWAGRVVADAFQPARRYAER